MVSAHTLRIHIHLISNTPLIHPIYFEMSNINDQIPPRVTFVTETGEPAGKPAYYKEEQGSDGLYRLKSCSKEEADIVDDDNRLPRECVTIVSVQPRAPTIIDVLQSQGRCFRKGTTPSTDVINMVPSQPADVPASVWNVPEGIVERTDDNHVSPTADDAIECMKQLIPDEGPRKYACELFTRSLKITESGIKTDSKFRQSMEGYEAPGIGNAGMVKLDEGRKAKAIADAITDETAKKLGFEKGHPRDCIRDAFLPNYLQPKHVSEENIGITKSIVSNGEFGYCSDMKQANVRVFRAGNGKTYQTIQPMFKLNLVCNAPPMTSARKDIPLKMRTSPSNLAEKLITLTRQLTDGNIREEELIGTKGIDGNLHIPLMKRIENDIRACTFWTGDYDGDDGEITSDSDTNSDSDELPELIDDLDDLDEEGCELYNLD